MKRGLVALVILAGFVAVPLAYALLAEQPVFFAAKNERNPAAGYAGVAGEVWAFTRSRTGDPNRYDAYAKKGANSPIKLNEAGQGWTGGMDYPIVSYQQVSGGGSDIYFYDLETDTDATHPAPINTAKFWEWHPSISGSMSDYHLLFGQDNTNNPTQRVILHHHSVVGPGAHESLELSAVTRASHYLQPDQLSGNWATYTRCTPRCNVVRYDVMAETKMTLAKPVTTRPRHQYAGAVTTSGAVYLVRSGPSCGEKVKIVRYDAARSDPALGTIVAALPSGFDIVFAFARENPGGSVDVFYDRVKCSTGRFDIYKINDPN
jgi:hypothetical protein